MDPSGSDFGQSVLVSMSRKGVETFEIGHVNHHIMWRRLLEAHGVMINIKVAIKPGQGTGLEMVCREDNGDIMAELHNSYTTIINPSWSRLWLS